MPSAAQSVDIGDVIQLSVAPVFLLTALGAFLGVLTSRMSRIIDRSRSLEAHAAGGMEGNEPPAAGEIRVLARRARLVNRAIRLCTLCALITSGLIIALFVGAFFRRNLAVVVGMMFIAAMLALCAGLISFLQEIALATRHLRIGLRHQ